MKIRTHLKKDVFIYISISLLLYLFCLRIWNIGITHHDDAVWLLAAIKNDWKVIYDFATQQGRIWAFVSGSIIFVLLKLEQSIIGDILKIGTFVIYFLLFYYTLAKYFGKTLSIIALTLNLGLFAIRWEGSVLTSYPGFTWILGTFFLLSILLGRLYCSHKNNRYLLSSIMCLFISLFIHEGLSVLFSVLFLASVFANHYIGYSNLDLFRNRVTNTYFRIFCYSSFIILFYFTSYLIWRLHYQSLYTGNTLAPFNPNLFMSVLLNFATSGNLIFDLFHPYSVRFVISDLGQLLTVSYSLSSFTRGLSQASEAIISGTTVFALLFYSLMNLNNTKKYNNYYIYLIMASLGAVIAILPIVPVALSLKYQTDFSNLGIYSYCQTVFCHFGISLVLAAFFASFSKFATINNNKIGNVLILMLCVCTGVLSIVGFRMNDNIVRDMRLETSRWKVLNDALRLAQKVGIQPKIFYVPRFANGSWFTVLGEVYWHDYIKAKFHKDIQIKEMNLEGIDLKNNNVVFLDYFFTYGKQVILMAPLVKTTNGENISNELVIGTGDSKLQNFSNYILYFNDSSGRFKRLSIQNVLPLEASMNNVWVIKDIEVKPETIHFSFFGEPN